MRQIFFFFKKTKHSLSENQTRKIFTNLCKTIKKIHNKGWVHHDLSHQNILIDTEQKIVS